MDQAYQKQNLYGIVGTSTWAVLVGRELLGSADRSGCSCSVSQNQGTGTVAASQRSAARKSVADFDAVRPAQGVPYGAPPRDRPPDGSYGMPLEACRRSSKSAPGVSGGGSAIGASPIARRSPKRERSTATSRGPWAVGVRGVGQSSWSSCGACQRQVRAAAGSVKAVKKDARVR